MRKSHLTRSASVIAFTAALLLAGCRPSAPKAQSFAGQATNSEAFVGIVNQDGSLTAYVCDGTETTVNTAEWFNGSAANGAFDLASADGAHLTGAITAQDVTGTLTKADGQSLAFSISPASGNAGVYRAEQTTGNGTYVGGWVVLPNGDQRGSVSFQGAKGDSYLPVGGVVAVVRLAFPLQPVVLQNQVTLTAAKVGG
jgi:hypothetical protein